MADLFIDTSGWATWVSPLETHHALAVETIDAALNDGRRLVTTSYVLTELTALFGRLRVPRPKQVEVLQIIRTDLQVEVLRIEPQFEEAAWTLWNARLDKDWTLVDCASFVVMGHLQLINALTTDHHFEQAGLLRLLKSP